jgi:hypothetical protein
MPKPTLCRWNCGRKTDRRCGVCLFCCDERDRQFASGAPYVSPSQRPGHRFYKKNLSEAQKVVLAKARASKRRISPVQIANSGVIAVR